MSSASGIVWTEVAAWGLLLGSLAWVGFAYAGYPLLLALLHRIAPRPVASDDIQSPISIVIAVHNGGAVLREKLKATLALEYAGPREIIVASDGSTDETDSIARELEAEGVLLVRREPRAGKEAAQAAGIARAGGELIVFTDVTAELSPDALREIVRPFADPSVGAVSSEDRVETVGGEGAYVRYEMAIRRLESETTSLIGLSGSFFAARRALCDPWATDLASDFRVALEAIRRGQRAVSAPRATARFKATEDPAAEWTRKVRTVRRGIAVLAAYRSLLSPRHGRVAFSIWGHKLARFTSPFALILALAASAALALQGSAVGGLLLSAQLLAYAVALLALVVRPVGAHLLPRLAGFFLLVNASMLVAWAYHLSGRRAVTWQPTRR